MTTATDIRVNRVTEDAVICTVNGEEKRLTWTTLKAAASQGDGELRATYSRILKQAETIAADGPVDIVVRQDATNVWWYAMVFAHCGGGKANYGRRADEGSAHPHASGAQAEADMIRARLGDRVRSCTREAGFGT